MGWLKSLFGGGSSGPGSEKAVKSLVYKEFLVEAKPYKEGSQFQLAGVISKEIDGSRRDYRFVRADRFSTVEEASDFALAKGRQLVDEQGERLFAPQSPV